MMNLDTHIQKLISSIKNVDHAVTDEDREQFISEAITAFCEASAKISRAGYKCETSPQALNDVVEFLVTRTFQRNLR